MTSGSPLSRDERSLAMACHLLSLAGYVMPMGNIIGPLLLWVSKRETSAFVDAHGKETVNSQISMTIWILASVVLSCFLIGIPLLFILPLIDLIYTILAAVDAQSGKRYRYPLTIRFIE
ncbi:MAG: DUF4870 domain-containing protein [Cyanobacteria bacterium J06628_6]